MFSIRARPKNLLLLHLESISWQQLHAFPEAFVNLSRIRRQARTYSWFISSATSTQMAMTCLLHGNDRELDASRSLSKLRIAGLETHLFERLDRKGYATRFLALNPRHSDSKPLLGPLAAALPRVEGSFDVGEFVASVSCFEGPRPAALYLWTLACHIEQLDAFTPHAAMLDEQVGGAFAVIDHVLGEVFDAMARAGTLETTTIVIFGDHGDDYWSHGFQGGQLHGTAPYLPMVHAPLMVIDPSLPPGTDNRLASMVDVLDTCNDLLGLGIAMSTPHSGRSLLSGRRSHAFSQNLLPGQPRPRAGAPKTFSVTDHSHHLMVSEQGLEMFHHRLDPSNHCNLLTFFAFGDDGSLRFRDDIKGHQHFQVAIKNNETARAHLVASYNHLKEVLSQHVSEKNCLASSGEMAGHDLITAASFQTINATSRPRGLK